MTEVLGRTETELTEWTTCGRCRALLYHRWIDRSDGVCPECGWHHPLTAMRRLGTLLDPGSTEVIDIPTGDHDVLGFIDSKPYPERLAQARAQTGLRDAVVVATGTIGGRSVVAAVMDFRFIGGSMGAAVGELVTQAAEIALLDRVPLILVTASGGARMQEGAQSLMQMAKTAQALGRMDEAGVLTVALITDPTYGGVAASYATLCDVIVAEPGARLGFAGPRVIQETIQRELPEGFQTAEYLLERGFIDAVVPRTGLRAMLGRLVAGGAPGDEDGGTDARHAAGSGADHTTALVRDPAELAERDAWDSVRRARDIGRPTTLDFIGACTEGFQELKGDRATGECAAIVGGIARLDGRAVMIIGHQKGHTAAELVERDFGMAEPAGYRKAARLMRLAAKLGMPVVTLIDTPGAHPGLAAEENGQAFVIAENLRLMAGLPVPIVAVVTGEGGSGGALALGVADRVLMLENAIYSVITPEGCSAILWRDRSQAASAAARLGLHAAALLEQGIVDGVVPEPAGGAHTDPHQAMERLRAALALSLDEIAGRSVDVLIKERRARFRRYGAAAAADVSLRGMDS
nr:acetyl-CoA carboxylase carboxyltransferase subunit [Actinoallomurus sp.]